MNVRYANAVLNAVQYVFSTMLETKVGFENPVSKQVQRPTYDISCIIGLTGALTGCIVLSLPDQIAKKIASTMLQEDVRHINEALIDAICEVTNMVTGRADTEMEIDNLYYSLPTVTIEQGKTVYPSNIFIFSMPCVSDYGRFEIDIALTPGPA